MDAGGWFNDMGDFDGIGGSDEIRFAATGIGSVNLLGGSVGDYTAAIKDGEIRDKFQRNNVEYKTDWQCNYCDWRRKCWADKLESGKMWHGDMEVT
jgi:hypothetical protein